MKKSALLLIVFIHFAISALPQVLDDFSDGDLTNDPEWSGDLAGFLIVDSVLRTDGPEDKNTLNISTPVVTNELQEWRLAIDLKFAPSGSNQMRFYLVADSANLSSSTHGYYLEIGQTGADQFHLKEIKEGAVTTKLSGETKYSGEVEVVIRIINRDDEWQLFIEDDSEFLMEGKVAGNLDLPNEIHAGIYCKYTSTRRDRFYFDDFYAGPVIKDTIAPVMLSHSIVEKQSLSLLFSEPIVDPSAEDFILNELYAPTSIDLEQNILNLTFDVSFREGENNIFISNIADLAENILPDTTLSFDYYTISTPARGDILINEFMADPSPSIELPESEYIELWNVSDKHFDISQLRINDRIIIEEKTLLMAGSYLILCPQQNEIDFLHYGHTIGMSSWDVLSNSGDEIILSELSLNRIIDNITYSSTWFVNDSQKGEGGYALERIHAQFPCNQKFNWSFSNHEQGGSPGAKNTLEHKDQASPNISYSIASNSNSVSIKFSEALDPLSLQLTDFSLPDISFSRLSTNNDGDEVYLSTVEEIEKNKKYLLEINKIADCYGNELIDKKIMFVLPDSIMERDFIITELLFDPYSTGEDFVEIYNYSDKYLNLQDLVITNDTSKFYIISTEPKVIYPQSYLAITTDSSKVVSDYLRHGDFHQLSSMPSMPNEEGRIFLMSGDKIIDSVYYHEEQHLEILNSTEGVSLEKILIREPSSNRDNWQSAASAAGFATPGLENSQNMLKADNPQIISFSSPWFTPNQDGDEDILVINYSLAETGMIGTLTIYDPFGNEIYVLASNASLNTEGSLFWDGITSEGTLANTGHYILIAEIFSVQGNLIKVKEKFALLR